MLVVLLAYTAPCSNNLPNIPEFAYPSIWTEDWQNYLANKKKLIAKIEDYMENYKKYIPLIYKQKNKLKDTFFSGTKLYGVISNG